MPRVVSINLCTDQLAMLLAAPGQILSVSWLAAEPRSSSMAEEARAYPLNRAQAEQIYLMQPDVVLAGEYGHPVTLALLRRLGLNVVQIPSVNSLADVAEPIRQTARAMGRAAEGERLIAEYEAALAALTRPRAERRAAIYQPNGYTSGRGTLADDMLTKSGFRNIAAEVGLEAGGTLPLERLVLAAPEVILTSALYPGASRAEEVLSHPALRAQEGIRFARTDADWVCGTPHLLRALTRMGVLHDELEREATE